MADYDFASLEPGEVAFSLRTDVPIDLRRLTRFLNSLNRVELAPGIAPLRADVVALWPGSSNGKLRYRMPKKPFTDKQLEKIHAVAVERLGQSRGIDDPAHREMMDALNGIAAEMAGQKGDKAADANHRRKEARKSSAALALSAIATVTAVATALAAAEPNPQNRAMGELMAKDCVEQADFHSRDCHVQIPSKRVPAYLQRIDSRELYSLDWEDAEAHARGYIAPNPAQLPRTKMVGGLLSAPIAPSTEFLGGRDVRFGRARLQNDTWYLDINPYALMQPPRTIPIYNATETPLTSGAHYRMHGYFGHDADGARIFVATSIQPTRTSIG